MVVLSPFLNPTSNLLCCMFFLGWCRGCWHARPRSPFGVETSVPPAMGVASAEENGWLQVTSLPGWLASSGLERPDSWPQFGESHIVLAETAPEITLCLDFTRCTPAPSPPFHS